MLNKYERLQDMCPSIAGEVTEDCRINKADAAMFIRSHCLNPADAINDGVDLTDAMAVASWMGY